LVLNAIFAVITIRNIRTKHSMTRLFFKLTD
jgi:hypothetical protein